MSKLPPVRPLAGLLVSLVLWPAASWALHGNAPGLSATDVSKTPWGEAPPILNKGAKFAVLAGDPGKPGPFVARLSFPAGYRVAPHWHSNPEHVTVISGTVTLGLGDKFDAKAMHAYKAGDYFSIAGKTNHYAQAKSAAVIQIHGEGPFDLVYINEADDPQKKMATKKQP